jgi:hypothetical protein
LSYYNVLFQGSFDGTTSPQFVIENPSVGPLPVSQPDPILPPGTGGSTSGQLPGTPTSPTQNPPPVTATLTTNHSTVHSRVPVRITLTLKNVTSKSERLTPDSSADSITVLDGSTVVSTMTRSLLTSKAKTLKPGQSIQLTSTWNGKPRQPGPGLTKLNPGIYTVEVDQGGYTASTKIRVE